MKDKRAVNSLLAWLARSLRQMNTEQTIPNEGAQQARSCNDNSCSTTELMSSLCLTAITMIQDTCAVTQRGMQHSRWIVRKNSGTKNVPPRQSWQASAFPEEL